MWTIRQRDVGEASSMICVAMLKLGRKVISLLLLGN